MSESETSGNLLTQSDKSLVVAVRDGDQYAANLLYDRYVRRVMGLIHQQMGHKLRARTEPEDIAQSVFKSMFRGVLAGKYDAPESSTLWNLIALIAVNKLRDYGARYSRQCRDSAREVDIDDGNRGSLPAHISEEAFELSIRETLEILPPFHQQVVDLRLQGNTVEEISQAVDSSRRRVERSLQTSRERLATFLIDGDDGAQA